MPRVLVLHTGGTLMMRARAEDDSSRPSLTPDVYGRDLAVELPSLLRIAELETRILFTMDSGDMQPENWVAIAREVHAALENPRFDGVVIVHGTDTMAYTASALGLLLGPLPKPVVLTGAQRPLAHARTDARENLINAVLVATLGVPEVTIAFASRALRGVRTTKRDAWGSRRSIRRIALRSWSSGLAWKSLRTCETERDLLRSIHASTRVFSPCACFRGSILHSSGGRLGLGCAGSFSRLTGRGISRISPDSLIPALEEARARGVPALIVSQCLRGFVDMTAYAGGTAAKAAGAISGGDMTVEAAIAKSMIGLASYDDPAALRAWLEADVSGERTAMA